MSGPYEEMRPTRITNHNARTKWEIYLNAYRPAWSAGNYLLALYYFFRLVQNVVTVYSVIRYRLMGLPDTVCNFSDLLYTWISSTQILSSWIVLGELKLDSRHRLLLALRSSKRAPFSACVQLFAQNYYIASWKALLPVLPRERSNFSRNKFHSCPY